MPWITVIEPYHMETIVEMLTHPESRMAANR
jgi:hypothetical protein